MCVCVVDGAQYVYGMVMESGNIIGAIKARSEDPICASYAEIYLLGQIMRVGASVVLGA